MLIQLDFFSDTVFSPHKGLLYFALNHVFTCAHHTHAHTYTHTHIHTHHTHTHIVAFMPDDAKNQYYPSLYRELAWINETNAYSA